MPLEFLLIAVLTEGHGRAYLVTSTMDAAKLPTPHKKEMASLTEVTTLETEKEKTSMTTNGRGQYLCGPHGSTHICLQGLECMKTA